MKGINEIHEEIVEDVEVKEDTSINVMQTLSEVIESLAKVGANLEKVTQALNSSVTKNEEIEEVKEEEEE